MLSGIRIGRIAGIDVHVDWSLAIIFFLILFNLGAGVFPAWHPDWSVQLDFVMAFVAAMLLFVSVLIHELSHAVVGRRVGAKVNRITLFIFGGMAQLDKEPPNWKGEFWMALVGPLVSLALGVIFLILAGWLGGPIEVDPEDPMAAVAQMGPAATLLFWLGPINLILAVFNLIPGFPLDGGRVLRALMWGISGSLRRATRWASGIGQAFGWALIALGIAMIFGLHIPIFGGGLLAGLWFALIGWFLNTAAVLSYRQLIVRESLEDVPVERVMQPNFVSVSPLTHVDQLVDDFIMRSEQRAYPVIEDGRLIGLVCAEDVRKIPRDTWAKANVREIMTPADRLTQVSADQDAADALFALSRRGVNQVPVVDHGRVRGMVRREDILKWLTIYSEPSAGY